MGDLSRIDSSQVAQSNNILLYFDIVLNQKAAADGTERCRAIQVDPNGESPYFCF